MGKLEGKIALVTGGRLSSLSCQLFMKASTFRRVSQSSERVYPVSIGGKDTIPSHEEEEWESHRDW